MVGDGDDIEVVFGSEGQHVVEWKGPIGAVGVHVQVETSSRLERLHHRCTPRGRPE